MPVSSFGASSLFRQEETFSVFVYVKLQKAAMLMISYAHSSDPCGYAEPVTLNFSECI